MRVSKRAVIIPDQHFPIHDQQAVNCVLKALEIIKPNIFINLGDVLENENVSPFRYRGKKLPSLEFMLGGIDDEIRQGNEGVDQFDKVLDKIKCKERYILSGNHDQWLDFFVEKYPYMKDYTFRKALHWDKRGYKYFEYNEPLKIGKLNFIHGAYATVYHAKKHLEAYGSNIVYGHTHDIQRHSLTKLDSGTIGAWSLGCLKAFDSKYNPWLRGRLHNWNHGFGIIDFYNNGNFKVEVVEIVKGITSVWGKMINGR